MTDKITIANQALSLVRGDSITSFEDQTNEAEAIRLFYDQTYRYLLSLNRWSFGVKKTKLNRTNNEPENSYRYQHYLPDNNLRLWAVYDSDESYAEPIQEYEVVSPEGNKRINSNSKVLVAEFIKENNEYQLPPDFVELFYHALAANICLSITEDKPLQDILRSIAYGNATDKGRGGLLRVAASNDSQQSPARPIQGNILTDARFGSSGRYSRRFR